jgi:hypothetical protein
VGRDDAQQRSPSEHRVRNDSPRTGVFDQSRYAIKKEVGFVFRPPPHGIEKRSAFIGSAAICLRASPASDAGSLPAAAMSGATRARIAHFFEQDFGEARAKIASRCCRNGTKAGKRCSLGGRRRSLPFDPLQGAPYEPAIGLPERSVNLTLQPRILGSEIGIMV